MSILPKYQYLHFLMCAFAFILVLLYSHSIFLLFPYSDFFVYFSQAYFCTYASPSCCQYIRKFSTSIHGLIVSIFVPKQQDCCFVYAFFFKTSRFYQLYIIYSQKSLLFTAVHSTKCIIDYSFSHDRHFCSFRSFSVFATFSISVTNLKPGYWVFIGCIVVLDGFSALPVLREVHVRTPPSSEEEGCSHNLA